MVPLTPEKRPETARKSEGRKQPKSAEKKTKKKTPQGDVETKEGRSIDLRERGHAIDRSRERERKDNENDEESDMRAQRQHTRGDRGQK
jgi:hypothetical protein